MDSEMQMNDTNSNISGIVAKIEERLFQYYGDFENEQVRGIEILSILKRPYSSVVFLLVKLKERRERLAVKVIANNQYNLAIIKEKNQSLVEYNIIKELYNKFIPVAGCSVPRPLLVIPELNSYITLYIDGPMLSDEMKYARYLSPKKKFQSLKKRFYLCGKWLKCFQEFTGKEETDAEILEGMIERCQSRLQVIEEAEDSRCPKNLKQIVMDSLNDCISNLAGRKIVIAGRHGDFHPFNIIANTEGVTVIDFFGYKKEPLVVDLLKMHVYLDDEMKSLSTSRQCIMELCRQFLYGYGYIGEVNNDILIICETQHRVLSLANCVIYKQGKIQHRLARNSILNKQLEWLCSSRKRKLDLSVLPLVRIADYS